MNYKRFPLLPATLLFCCFACKSPSPVQEKEFLSEIEEENFSSFSQETSPVPTPPVAQPSPFWDTENVDVSHVDKNKKLIAFTFDDAPGRTLENILALFASYNERNPDCIATATVFFNGVRIDRQSLHLAHAAYALGFELGNHTHAHLDLTTLSREELTREISQTDALLEKVDGQPFHLLRAPFGKVSEQVREAANVPLIDWTIDTVDWTGVDVDSIFSSVWTKRFDGAIVLMHDGYEATVSALKLLLPALKQDGYQAVTLSQMAKLHDCRLEKGKVYIRARKQRK